MNQNNAKNGLFTATCATYLVILTCFCILRIAAAMGLYDGLNDAAADIVFSVMSQIVIMFSISVLGIWLFKRKQKSSPQSFADFVIRGVHENGVLRGFGFKKISANIVLWSFILAFAMFFFNIIISALFNGILALMGHRGAAAGGGDMPFTGTSGFLIMMLIVAILPGICEETAHRGMLLRGFSSRIGILSAVMFSAVLFGLMHLNIVQFFYATVMGYFMGLAAVAARSIWPAIIIHFTNNGLSVYLNSAQENGWLFGNFMTKFGTFWGENSFFLYILFVFLLYFSIVFVIQTFAKMSFIEKFKHLETPPMVPMRVAKNRGMLAIKYYITAAEPRDKTPLNPLEKTLFFGMIFLGACVTIFTFAWGML